MIEKDIVFETKHYWVKRVPKGFEVYKTGVTHSTRVAVIGYTGDKGLQRAKDEIARREAARGTSPASTCPSERQHATKKKSPAQLQREIDEALARAPKKVAGFARPATRQPGYQIVSVPILKGPRGIGPSGLDSPREHNESVVFSTRAEAEAYLPAVKRFAADFGREAVIKEVW